MEGLALGFAGLMAAIAAMMIGVGVLSFVAEGVMAFYAFTGPTLFVVLVATLVIAACLIASRCIWPMVVYTTEYDAILEVESDLYEDDWGEGYAGPLSDYITFKTYTFLSADARANFLSRGYRERINSVIIEDRIVPANSAARSRRRNLAQTYWTYGGETREVPVLTPQRTISWRSNCSLLAAPEPTDLRRTPPVVPPLKDKIY